MKEYLMWHSLKSTKSDISYIEEISSAAIVDPVGRPQKIGKSDKRLFLKVLKQVRKSLKRGNQYIVAIEVKRLFKIAFNVEYWLQDEMEYIKTDNLDIVTLETNKNNLLSVLKLNFDDYYHYYKCGEAHYSSLGGRFYYTNDQVLEQALNRLAVYFINASPAAIVQMKKRLSTKKLNLL